MSLIKLPINDENNVPYVWDTEKLYSEHCQAIQKWCQSLSTHERNVITEGACKRPVTESVVVENVKVILTTTYIYPVGHPQCFIIKSQVLTIEEI